MWPADFIGGQVLCLSLFCIRLIEMGGYCIARSFSLPTCYCIDAPILTNPAGMLCCLALLIVCLNPQGKAVRRQTCTSSNEVDI